MDYKFPQQLYPTFYNSGPPDSVLKHSAGRWGGYEQVLPQGGSGPISSWTFTSLHQAKGETWRHTEPVLIPLLPPKHAVVWPSTPPDPLDFTQHMQNFFVDHSQDAFGSMSQLLAENFTTKPARKKHQNDAVNIQKVKSFTELLRFKRCQRTYSSSTLDRYCALMSDVVHAIPPELLGALLYEELTQQRESLLFPEATTGGALAFVPGSYSSSSGQRGCLLYPGNQGLDCLT